MLTYRNIRFILCDNMPAREVRTASPTYFQTRMTNAREQLELARKASGEISASTPVSSTDLRLRATQLTSSEVAVLDLGQKLHVLMALYDQSYNPNLSRLIQDHVGPEQFRVLREARTGGLNGNDVAVFEELEGKALLALRSYEAGFAAGRAEALGDSSSH